MKIHIVGAAGAGKTTLGAALANKLGFPVFDCDTYFWEKSQVPFTVKRDHELRNKMLLNDLEMHKSWVLSGSMVSWGEVWPSMFDLVVFLLIPKDIRMQRLHNREVERYGDAIYNDPQRADLYKNFIDWAAGYDDNTTNGRTLAVHQNWLKKLKCPVLEINGNYTTNKCVQLITEAIIINNY